MSTALYALTYAALDVLGLHYLVAVTCAYVLGIAFGFVVQGRWAFGGERTGIDRLPIYAAVQLTGMLVAVGGIALLVEVLGASPVVAQLIAYPLVSLLTYGSHRRWTFRPAQVPRTSLIS